MHHYKPNSNLRHREILKLLVVALFAALFCAHETETLQAQTGAQSPEANMVTPGQAKKPQDQAAGGMHALLIGCTRYDHLPKERHLLGPANDVLLLRKVLAERFQFPADGMVTLAEGGDANSRPIRANIEREFALLAKRTGPGDRVVILLSGHGSRQPSDLSDKDDIEADGLDEVFCPADVRGLSADGKQLLENAIIDDELKVWVQRIVNTGASVWLIADCCHSGTISRSDWVRRGFDPADLVSADAVSELAPAGQVSRGMGEETQSWDVPKGGSGSFVALYASQPHQETYEATFDGTRYGLLTYCLCHSIMQCDEPITYRELQQRIYKRYRQRDGYPPTPFLEGARQQASGDTRDLEVLGTTAIAGRARIALHQGDDGRWRLNAGGLQDLTPGSIVAVYPAVGKSAEQIALGHLKVVSVLPWESIVEPCAYGGLPLRQDFPPENRGEVVYFDYGLRRLKIGVDPMRESPAVRPGLRPKLAPLTSARIQELRGKLQRWSELKQPSAVVVNDISQADWLLRVRPQGLFLVPRESEMGVRSENVPAFGPLPEDDNFSAWLSVRLARIARASQLQRMANSSVAEPRRASKSVQVDVEMLKYVDGIDAAPRAVAWERNGVQLNSGDIVGFRITNRGRNPVDVCLLFVDSAFGISQYFPEPGTAGNRLQPGEKLETSPGEVQADTIGQEHLVLVAVAAKPLQAPLDLAFLEQPNCLQDNQTRGERSAPAPRTGSPLEQFLAENRTAEGAQRGFGRVEIDSHELKMFTWETLAKP